MGNHIEKICNKEIVEEGAALIHRFTRGGKGGTYAKLNDKDVIQLARQTNKDFNDFWREDEWWTQQDPCLFYPEKFIYLYPNYKEEQNKLDLIFKDVNLNNIRKSEFKRIKNEVLLFQWKYIIRKGVPLKKTRILALEMFKKSFENNDSEYEAALHVAFQGQIPSSFKNTNTFADEEKLEDVLKINFLTPEGMHSAKKILWVFRKSFAKLDYSPMLPQVIALLLMFLTEAETFTVTRRMLEESAKLLDETQQYMAEEMKGLRWHLTLNREDFEKFIATFYNYVIKKSTNFAIIEKHLTRIGYNYVDLFSDWFKNLFFGFLPLPVILKIFVTYLNEGIKIYYRMGYALLRTFKNDILNHNDPDTLTELLRDRANNIKPAQIDKMIKKAYALPLSSLNKRFSKVQIDLHDSPGAKIFYMPYVSKSSNIINNQQFETLWEWLPREYKLSDPTLTYTSSKDGWSLKTLYTKTEPYSEHCMLILIKSDRDTVFGAFVDKVFKPDWQGKQYTGSNESFVFQLEPEELKFACTNKNSDHLVCGLEYFSIGNGGDGPAIYLDSELLNGQTYKCETYGNPQFNGKDNKSESSFQCLALEVYVFN